MRPVPVVDLAAPDTVVAEQVHQACSTQGFFHGAPFQLIIFTVIRAAIDSIIFYMRPSAFERFDRHFCSPSTGQAQFDTTQSWSCVHAVVNHGIDQELQDKLFEQLRLFFSLPANEKVQVPANCLKARYILVHRYQAFRKYSFVCRHSSQPCIPYICTNAVLCIQVSWSWQTCAPSCRFDIALSMGCDCA